MNNELNTEIPAEVPSASVTLIPPKEDTVNNELNTEIPAVIPSAIVSVINNIS